jgi:hypothetical protein
MSSAFGAAAETADDHSDHERYSMLVSKEAADFVQANPNVKGYHFHRDEMTVDVGVVVGEDETWLTFCSDDPVSDG